MATAVIQPCLTKSGHLTPSAGFRKRLTGACIQYISLLIDVLSCRTEYFIMHDTNSDTTQSRSELCRVCRKIDFNRYLGEEIRTEIHLGRLKDISRSRNCPFCRLVIHACEADPSAISVSADTGLLLQNELSWKLGIEPSPYDRSRSESYSNKYDLRSQAKRCPKDAYRFTIVPKADRSHSQCEGTPSYRGIIQYLAHKEKDPADRQFFGRKVAFEAVNMDAIRSWLDLCTTWHGIDCERDVGKIEDPHLTLRLVDVGLRSIVKMSTKRVPSYVALSYVWGTREMEQETGMAPAMLLRRDVRWGTNEQSIPLPLRLPKTIEDAIELTRRLGYRYLWVDALCIVQDDSLEEKIPHLSNMKFIYSGASLTLAAAAGEHADHGIAGVGLPRKYHQYSEIVKGLPLATMFPSFTALENSSKLLWNTRGWTLQEKLLSNRLLLFTDYQVYFKCSESIWTEEINMETARLSRSARTRRAKYRWQPKHRARSPHDEVGLSQVIERKRLKIQDELTSLRGFVHYAAVVEEY